MKHISLPLLLSTLTLVACTKTPAPICQELDTSIDENIKRVALTLAEGEIMDKGSAQQLAQYTMANNYLQIIQLNVDMQTHHSCPIRKAVIDPFVFRSDASKCVRATLGEQKTDATALCDMKNWKPG